MSGGQSSPPKDVRSQAFSAHATQALEFKHMLWRAAPPLPDVLVGNTKCACDGGDSACRAQRFCERLVPVTASFTHALNLNMRLSRVKVSARCKRVISATGSQFVNFLLASLFNREFNHHIEIAHERSPQSPSCAVSRSRPRRRCSTTPGGGAS